MMAPSGRNMLPVLLYIVSRVCVCLLWTKIYLWKFFCWWLSNCSSKKVLNS